MITREEFTKAYANADEKEKEALEGFLLALFLSDQKTFKYLTGQGSLGHQITN